MNRLSNFCHLLAVPRQIALPWKVRKTSCRCCQLRNFTLWSHYSFSVFELWFETPPTLPPLFLKGAQDLVSLLSAPEFHIMEPQLLFCSRVMIWDLAHTSPLYFCTDPIFEPCANYLKAGVKSRSKCCLVGFAPMGWPKLVSQATQCVANGMWGSSLT